MFNIKNEENIAVVIQYKAELLAKIDAYKIHCAAQERTIEDLLEFSQFNNWHQKNLSEFDAFLNEVDIWLGIQAPIDGLGPDDSVSQAGTMKSAKSSTSKSDLVERQIKHEVNQKRLKHELWLKEQELEAKINYEKLQLRLQKEKMDMATKNEEEEIEKIKAEYDRKSGVSLQSKRKFRQPNSNPGMFAASPPVTIQSVHLPRIEPEVFDGEDPTKYISFSLSFEKIISCVCNNEADQYYNLQRYTKGYPHELVKSCLSPDLGKSFRDAWDLLYKHYGDKVIIAQTYLDRLDKWPSIKPEDPKALDEFSLYLTTISNMMSGSHHLS